MSIKSALFGSCVFVAAAAFGASVYVWSNGQHPCIDPAGEISWTRTTCPAGTEPVPNTCDLGWCIKCPPEGCPELVEALMCCGAWSGEDQGCFPIVETTGECPDGSDITWCEYGSSNADGSETCYIP